MSSLKKLKSILDKIKLIIIFSPSILLILGYVFIFFLNNILSLCFSLMLPVFFILNIVVGIYWLIERNRWYWLSFFCLAIYISCFNSFFQFNSPSKELSELSILSYNTHGFNYYVKDRKLNIDDEVVKFVTKENPDIFCVQEFSAIKYKLFKAYKYHYRTNRFTENKSVMAVFSKFPIVNKGYISFSNSNNGAMYIDLEINENIIRIYNVHLESFKVPIMLYDFSKLRSYNIITSRINNAEKVRKEQAMLVKEHIDKFKGKVIVCGDFNSTQFSSVYNLLKTSKKDSFIEAGNGFGETYELFKYPFRLDYILTDESFKVLSHDNFNLKLSDHEPILVNLSLN